MSINIRHGLVNQHSLKEVTCQCGQLKPCADCHGIKNNKNRLHFNEESTLKLIELYKSKGALWNRKHLHHFNKLRREDALEEIALELNIDTEIIKRKLTSLLSALRRERAKIKKSYAKGQNDVYKSNWFAFEHFKFLWEKDKQFGQKYKSFIKRKEHKISRNQVVDEVDNNIDLIETETSSTTIKVPCKLKPRVKLRFHQSNAPQSTSSNSSDESQDFGNVVAKKLRKYDDTTRSKIEAAIMGIFLKADQGLLDRSDVSPAYTLNCLLNDTNSASRCDALTASGNLTNRTKASQVLSVARTQWTTMMPRVSLKEQAGTLLVPKEEHAFSINDGESDE